MVLEAYEMEDAINSGGVRLAPRCEAIRKRWRILNEYEDEDPEFRPAFAFGSHKMDEESSYEQTKRKAKPFMAVENPLNGKIHKLFPFFFGGGGPFP